MDRAAEKIRALECKVAELQADLDYWTELGRPPPFKRMRRVREELGLQPFQAMVLKLIAKRRTVSNEMILTCLGIERHGNYPAVVISNLRKALRPHGITIINLWGWGYEISESDQDKILRLLGECETEDMVA